MALWVTALLASPLLFQVLPLTNKFDRIEDLSPLMLFTLVQVLLGSALLILWHFQKKQKNSTSPASLSPWIVLSLFGFITWSSLSFLFSEIHSFGFGEVYGLFNFGLLFFISQNKAIKEQIQKHLPKLIIALILLHLIIGTYVFFNFDHSRFVGAFANLNIKADAWPNAFGTQFLLLFPLLFTFKNSLKSKSAKLKSILFIILTSAFLGSFFLSFSRAAILAFIIQILILGLFFWREIFSSLKSLSISKQRNRNLKKLISSSLVLLLSFIFISSYQALKTDQTQLADRIQFQEEEGGTSISERLEFFEGSIELIKENIVWGTGPGSFKWVYPQVQESFLALSDHPHNLLLKIASERGLPSLFFFLSFLLLLFINSNPFSSKASTQNKVIWAAILGSMAHNMVDYNFNFLSNSLVLWILFASLTLSSNKVVRTNKLFTHVLANSKRYTKNLSLLLILVLIFSSLKLTTDTLKTHKLNSAAIEGTLTVEEITSFSPLLTRWNLFRLYDQIQQNSPSSEAIKTQLLSATMEQELSLNTKSTMALERLINLKLESNDFEAALTLSLQHIELNPKNTFLGRMHALSILKELNMPYDALLTETSSLIEEYQKLYDINLHYTQSSPEMEYVKVIQSL